jgi:hypothetical protein
MFKLPPSGSFYSKSLNNKLEYTQFSSSIHSSSWFSPSLSALVCTISTKKVGAVCCFTGKITTLAIVLQLQCCSYIYGYTESFFPLPIYIVPDIAATYIYVSLNPWLMDPRENPGSNLAFLYKKNHITVRTDISHTFISVKSQTSHIHFNAKLQLQNCMH